MISMLLVANAFRPLRQKEAIGNYEFTVTPRALFAPDGTILPCQDKSKLISLLNKLATRDYTGRSAARRWDGHQIRCSISQDSPGRWNGSSAEDSQETS